MISFDFDDTLLLTDEIKLRTLKEVCASAHPGGLGLEAVKGVQYDARKAPPGKEVSPRTIFRDVADGLLARGADPPCRDGEIMDAESWGKSMCRDFMAILEERLPKEAKEMPGASALLSHLSKHGIRCYVNTATPQGLVDKIVDSLGWRQWFEGVFGAPGNKEHHLETIAVKEKIKDVSTQLVHVGDGENDRRAAAEIGCIFVGVAPDGNSQFNGPTYATVTDMQDAAVALCGLLSVPPLPSKSMSQEEVAKATAA